MGGKARYRIGRAFELLAMQSLKRRNNIVVPTVILKSLPSIHLHRDAFAGRAITNAPRTAPMINPRGS